MTTATASERKPTVEADVVGFHESLLDLSVLHEQGVTLAAVVTKDGAAVEAQVQSLGELAGRVTQEANLREHNVRQ